jgi:hypothetical protein
MFNAVQVAQEVGNRGMNCGSRFSEDPDGPAPLEVLSRATNPTPTNKQFTTLGGTRMTRKLGLYLLLIALLPPAACCQIFQLAELNTNQIRALDRAKTVVLIPGGILGEHAPYLPSFTDG